MEHGCDYWAIRKNRNMEGRQPIPDSVKTWNFGHKVCIPEFLNRLISRWVSSWAVEPSLELRGNCGGFWLPGLYLGRWWNSLPHRGVLRTAWWGGPHTSLLGFGFWEETFPPLWFTFLSMRWQILFSFLCCVSLLSKLMGLRAWSSLISSNTFLAEHEFIWPSIICMLMTFSWLLLKLWCLLWISNWYASTFPDIWFAWKI